MAEFPALPLGSKRGTGYVYFLLAEQNVSRPMIKIGFSKRRPDGRLKDCRTGSPVHLEMKAIIVGRMIDERDLHKRFAEQHSHGEWFFFEGELRQFVEGLAG